MSFRVFQDAGWSVAGRAARESEEFSYEPVSSWASQGCFLNRSTFVGEIAGDWSACLSLSAGDC